MPVRTAAISKVEQDQLLLHLRKHPIYPYSFIINTAINAGTFPTGDPAGVGSYRTFVWTPPITLGLVSVATNFIITPNTAVGIYSLAISYGEQFSMQEKAAPYLADEGSHIYELKSNGGAINDFQVFYPLNWYLEKNQPIYIHQFADAATVAAGTATIRGRVTLGALQGGI